MATKQNFLEPFQILLRDGTEDNPYVDIEETINLVAITTYASATYNMAVLREIPLLSQGVVCVIDGTTTLTEIRDSETEIDTTNFKVDYTNGRVYLDESYADSTATFTYKGRGVIAVTAERISLSFSGEGIEGLYTLDNYIQEHLGEVNVGDLSTLLTTAKDKVVNAINEVYTDIHDHIDDLDNPHVVTKEQISLGNVNNLEQVDLVNNQTIAGVKTFSSSPIVPTPTTDFQAATKAYVDSAISGGVIYRGTFGSESSTTGGDLPTDPTQGDLYVCDMNDYTSTEASETFNIGDWAVYDGTVWKKLDSSDSVTSVFGRTGTIIATAGDYDASQIDYDNSTSGLTANDVQAAIDETKGDIPLTFDDLTDGTTNVAYTVTEQTKLSGIEEGADVTDTENVDAAGATMNTDEDVSGNSWVLDEDEMTSDSAIKVPTQQSVKAYIDNNFMGIAVVDSTTFDITFQANRVWYMVSSTYTNKPSTMEQTSGNIPIYMPYEGSSDTGIQVVYGTVGNDIGKIWARRADSGVWSDWAIVSGEELAIATGTDINTGTDNEAYVTSLAIEDSNLTRSTDESVQNFLSLTQEEYDAITPDENTIYYIEDGLDNSIIVEDNLTSTSAVDALSANQGRILNEKSIVESSTEPTGDNRTKYWFQYSKNLFDKDNFNVLYAYFAGSDGIIQSLSTTRTLYIPCQPNTQYTVSRTIGTRFSVGSIDVIPTIGETCNVSSQDNTASSITITTGTSDIYLCVFYYLSTTDTLTEQEILDSIQIEQNATATTYEAYINPTMWILNSNDVYEVFIDKTIPVIEYLLSNYIETGFTVTLANLVKKVDMIVINFNITGTFPANTSTTVANLPESLRPSTTVYGTATGLASGASALYPGYCAVTSAGAFILRSGSAATSVIGSLVYDI